MRRFVSLLLVMLLVVAMAAPAMATSSPMKITIVDDEDTDKETDEDTDKGSSSTAAATSDEETTEEDTETGHIFVVSDQETYDEALKILGEETITIVSADGKTRTYNVKDALLIAKVTGDSLAQATKDQLVKVSFASANITGPSADGEAANLSPAEFNEKYDVAVMGKDEEGNPIPVGITTLDGASMEVANGAIEATLPFDEPFAIFDLQDAIDVQ